jgi:hypothetical protein
MKKPAGQMVEKTILILSIENDILNLTGAIFKKSAIKDTPLGQPTTRPYRFFGMQSAKNGLKTIQEVRHGHLYTFP